MGVPLSFPSGKDLGTVPSLRGVWVGDASFWAQTRYAETLPPDIQTPALQLGQGNETHILRESGFKSHQHPNKQVSSWSLLDFLPSQMSKWTDRCFTKGMMKMGLLLLHSYYAWETHGALAETHPVKKGNKKEYYLKLKDILLNIIQVHKN